MSPIVRCPDCGHMVQKHDQDGCTLTGCRCDGTVTL